MSLLKIVKPFFKNESVIPMADTIEITVFSNTGLLGKSMTNGVELAVNEINSTGGVLGKLLKINPIEKDSTGLRYFQMYAGEEGAARGSAGIGFVKTDDINRSAKFYQGNYIGSFDGSRGDNGDDCINEHQEFKIPLIVNGATSSFITKRFSPPQSTDNYIFRNAASDDIQSQIIVEEAVTKRGFKKIAIFFDNNFFIQPGKDNLKKYLALKGITPVIEQKYDIAVNVTKSLQKARDAGAEVILIYGAGKALSGLVKGTAKINWKVPIIGNWTLSTGNFIDNAGPNREDICMAQTFIQEPNTPKRKAFIDAYLKTFNPDPNRIDISTEFLLGTSLMLAAQGYDSIYLIAAAIKQAGSADGPMIKKALENLKAPVEGVVKIYNKPFSKEDHEAIKVNDLVIGKIKDGKVVYAYEQDRIKGYSNN